MPQAEAGGLIKIALDIVTCSIECREDASGVAQLPVNRVTLEAFDDPIAHDHAL